jgi:sulfate adenylyltransferase subunit 1
MGQKQLTEQLQIVIVGHVDHGKSTMVGRLLHDTNSLPDGKFEEVQRLCKLKGIDMEYAYILDALTEEQEQNITIDIAHIYFKTEKREYAIIDAPGHREFVKNMITGASQAEAAVLIVDAKEGVQEQTRRHAYILSMLGLRNPIVVMNKMDLIGYSEERYNKVCDELRAFLAKISITPREIVPISARSGEHLQHSSENMEWYQGHTLIQALDAIEKKGEKKGAFRMPVQDVYKIDGKRIIAGRVESGRIKVGDDIIVLPTGEKTTVKSIEEFLKPEKTEAIAGECLGITTTDPLFLDRGHVICDMDQARVVKELKGHLFWMSKEPLTQGETVTLKCSTQSVRATITEITERIDSSTLEVLGRKADLVKNREVGKINFTLDKPLVVDSIGATPELGRFVIEKNMNIVGGGIVEN